MPPTDPADLDTITLARRLCDLAGDERRVQVDFLLHLDEFDRRQAFVPLGFGSLWDWCLKALHLREGPAGRRIGAMRVLRRFPRLEAPLRDGRLCLSTVTPLGQILTEDNLEEVVRRAAFLTKEEVEHLVASIRPRAAPREGIRRIAAGAPVAAIPIPTAMAPAEPVAPAAIEVPAVPGPASDVRGAQGDPVAHTAARVSSAVPAIDSSDRRLPSRVELQPVSRDLWSLRVTLDGALRRELDMLRELLSHKVPGGELAEVMREAVRCGIEKYGKRRGVVPPSRSRGGNPAPASGRPATPRAVPAAVRRQVWSRDGGRCTFEAEDGRRCESRWQLELDHIVPAAFGGEATAENLRLRCRRHNLHHAEEVFGREHMARFRGGGRASPRMGESAHPGMS